MSNGSKSSECGENTKTADTALKAKEPENAHDSLTTGSRKRKATEALTESPEDLTKSPDSLLVETERFHLRKEETAAKKESKSAQFNKDLAILKRHVVALDMICSQFYQKAIALVPQLELRDAYIENMIPPALAVLHEIKTESESLLAKYGRPVFYVIIIFGSKGRYGHFAWWFSSEATQEQETWLQEWSGEDDMIIGESSEFELPAAIQEMNLTHAPSGELTISKINSLCDFVTLERTMTCIGWTATPSCTEFREKEFAEAIDTSNENHDKLHVKWNTWLNERRTPRNSDRP